MGQKAMWPPRPGDEAFDGSGKIGVEDANRKVGNIPLKSLNDALNTDISATRWRLGLKYGGGPAPGKRSSVRTMLSSQPGNRDRKVKRSFWSPKFGKDWM